MAVQMRIQQQIDGLEVLKDWLSQTTPEAVKKAHEQARREIALTEDERKKAEEARVYIRSYDNLKADIETKEIALKESQDIHAANVLKASSDLASRSKELDQKDMAIDAKIKAYDEFVARYEEDVRKLAEEKHRLAEEDSRNKEKLQEEYSKLQRDKSDHEVKRKELAELDIALKAKAKKLRESVADI